MIIQVSCEELKSFLKMCYSGGLVKDLVLHANTEKGIFARFATKEKSFYAEVYLKNVKIDEEGSIKIPHVKKLMDVISRIESKIVLIKSNEDVFTVTDGTSIGKMRADMLQVGDAEIVESYNDIQNLGQMFDTSTLNYSIAGIEYKNGCKLTCGMLNEVLKDAKAFGYEVYNFQAVKTKKGVQLRCLIINEHTTERVQRVIADNDFIGDIETVQDITVGRGFREILDGALGEEKAQLSIYFHENSLLITDGVAFFFNLHTLEN